MIQKFRWRDVKAEPVEMEGASGAKIRWLIDERRGARTFAMRVFELAEGGRTPLHSHDYEHEVFVLQGRGRLVTGGEPLVLEPGDVLFIPGGEEHQFVNEGAEPFFFICLIPLGARAGPGGR